jgi:hypothetical protein
VDSTAPEEHGSVSTVSTGRAEVTGRIQSYDIYRGLLLTAMILYHIVANFTSLNRDPRFSYWIPMGFVLFLGVILARFLQNRARKKLWLALKVLAAFFLLNIPKYLDPEFRLLTLVRGHFYFFSFEVLLPMGLLILFSIPLDRTKRVAWPLAALAYACIVAMSLAGFESYNLSFLLYGLVGYFVALRVDLHGLAVTQKAWYALPLVLISAVPFILLGFGYYVDYLFVLQVIACYFLLTRLAPRNRPLAFVGRHSFVIYIAHIVAIRIIVELTGW